MGLTDTHMQSLIDLLGLVEATSNEEQMREGNQPPLVQDPEQLFNQ